jgi:hypothetical protein
LPTLISQDMKMLNWLFRRWTTSVRSTTGKSRLNGLNKVRPTSHIANSNDLKVRRLKFIAVLIMRNSTTIKVATIAGSKTSIAEIKTNKTTTEGVVTLKPNSESDFCCILITVCDSS